MNLYSFRHYSILTFALFFGAPETSLAQEAERPNALRDQANQKHKRHHRLGLRLGSVGWGAEYKAQVNPYLDLRLVWQTLSPGRFEVIRETAPEASYVAQGNFRSNGFIADWYPWNTPIRFSFGVLQNRSAFRLREQSLNTPTNQYDANFGKLAYFFGTGWAPRFNSNPLTSNPFTLTLDVGLLAQQPPRLTWLNDSNTRDADETNRIWSERSRLSIELEEYKILPVFMIGLSYTLF